MKRAGGLNDKEARFKEKGKSHLADDGKLSFDRVEKNGQLP